MNPKIIKKPAFQIIGLQFRGNNDNNDCPKLWEKFSKRVSEVKPQALTPINAYGVCSNCDIEKNIFTYTAGFEVANVHIIPPEMVSIIIPEQEYAVFECTLPTLMKTLDDIHSKWLPQSNYIKPNTPEFELYEADFDPGIAQSPMYLYIPIKLK